METLSVPEEAASLHKLTAEGYDNIASKYHALFALKPTNTRLRFVQELAKDLSSGSKVLKLGCGSGSGSKPFIKQGCDLTGIEISTEQIALARENLPTATLVQADMMSVSFPPNSFDAVVGAYCLLHLSKENQQIILTRIVEWLKPGGWFACNFPAVTSDGNPGGQTSEWLGARMFWYLAGAEENRALMKEYGKGLKITLDEVVVDKLDAAIAAETHEPTETFHWFRAVKT